MIMKNPASGEPAPRLPTRATPARRRPLTPLPANTIVGRMTMKRPSAARALDLEQLADRIEELISVCESLQDENLRLRRRLAGAEARQQALVESGEETRRRIEGMISRLRILETEL